MHDQVPSTHFWWDILESYKTLLVSTHTVLIMYDTVPDSHPYQNTPSTFWGLCATWKLKQYHLLD